MKIYKYTIDKIADLVPLYLPVGTKLLSAQVQIIDNSSVLCIWALVNTTLNQTMRYNIRIVGTGHPFEDCYSYPYFIDTVQYPEYGIVFHVWSDN